MDHVDHRGVERVSGFQRLRESFRARALPHPHGVATASMGIGITGPNATDGSLESLVVRADKAL